MVIPEKVDRASTSFRVETVKNGFILHFVVNRTIGTIPNRYKITITDRRLDKSTPPPVSWSFHPSAELPPIDAVYGKRGREEDALRTFGALGNTFAGTFLPGRPVPFKPPPQRQFDMIRIYAGPGIAVNPDDDIRRYMAGGKYAGGGGPAALRGYTPDVEIFRLQSPLRVPRVGEAISPREILASHVRSVKRSDAQPFEEMETLAELMLDFDTVVEDMTVGDLLATIGMTRAEANTYYGLTDFADKMTFVRRDKPQLYAELYAAAYFLTANRVLEGDEVKFDPKPWGLRLVHLKSMVAVDIRVPTMQQDPWFDRDLREMTLGRALPGETSHSDFNAAFEVSIIGQQMEDRSDRMHWTAIRATEFLGAMTEVELDEQAMVTDAQNAAAVSSSVHWLLAPRLEDQGFPPILIIKTPPVRVTLSSPAIAEMTAQITEYRTGVRDASQSQELQHVLEANMVACWEVKTPSQMPQEGGAYRGNFPAEYKDLSLEGQRDRAQLLSDELKVDLLDTAFRMTPFVGDGADIAELGWGLITGRDAYGRKLTKADLALLGLGLLPLVSRSLLQSSVKLPQSLAKSLKAAEITTNVGFAAMLGKTVHDVWDVADFESPPARTAEFF